MSGFYQKWVIIIVTTVLFLNFPGFLYVRGILQISPVIWSLCFLLVLIPIIRGSQIKLVRVDPIVIWSYFFLLATFLGLFNRDHPTQSLEIVKNRVITVITLLILAALCSNFAIRTQFRLALSVAAVIAACLNIWELFGPVKFSDTLGRSAGTFINPNQSGYALTLALVLTWDVAPKRYRTAYQALLSVGVLLTLSRSAILIWAICLVLGQLDVLTQMNALLKRTLLYSSIVLLFLALNVGTTIQHLIYNKVGLSNDALNRIDFFSSGTARDTSASARAYSAQIAWERFTAHPLIGLGTGASRIDPPLDVVGPHNMFLTMMVDVGIVGALLVAGFLVALALNAKASFSSLAAPMFALLALCFFSHGVFDDRWIPIVFALIGTIGINATSSVHTTVTHARSLRQKYVTKAPTDSQALGTEVYQ